MSHANNRTHSATPATKSRARGGSGLPLWAGIAVLCAALAIGLVLSMLRADIGLLFLILFGVAAAIVVLTTEVRGLFLAVASMPFIFGVFTVITGWLVTQAQAAEGAAPFSKTAIVTSIFPLVQFFPALITITGIAALVAFLRVWLRNKNAQTIDEKAQVSRRATAEADRRNRESSSRAREQSKRLSVAELVERSNASRQRREGRAGSVRSSQPTRTREERRKEQAAQREAAAKARIERAREGRDAAERQHAERIERGRIAREQAEQAAARRNVEAQSRRAEAFDANAPRRPDPNRRAGQPQVPDYRQESPSPSAYEQSTPDGPRRQAKPAKPRRRHSRLDDNLYGDE